MHPGLRLLGTPQISTGGEWHDLPLDKRLALITHLACADGWVTRERLSYLFWPDVPTSQARMNLRQLLARTRAVARPGEIEADGQRLRLLMESDVLAFRRALAADEWSAALRVYGGDLAEGLEVYDSFEFQSWLESERTQLREAFRSAALKQSEIAAAEGRPDEAHRILGDLLERDPLDESVVQRRLRLPVASFVGRDDELAAIAARLTVEPCRLLTLVGPGGTGKTRLALRAAASLAASFADGATFVPLASVGDPGSFPMALAAALDLDVKGATPPIEQVIGLLRDRSALLVLDQFEHILDAAVSVADVLGACPGVRCLITSRERLRLEGEWLLPVQGPVVPDPR